MKHKTKNNGHDTLAVGAAALFCGFLAQRILLQPKTEVKLSENFTFQVSGIMPFSQKYIAAAARKAFNDVFPFALDSAVKVSEALKLKEQTKRFTVWFLYDFLGKYSLGSIFGVLEGRLKIVDRNQYKDAFRAYVQKIIMEKEDSDEIIKNVTLEIVTLMRLVTEGTVAALLFNERFAEAASGTIAAAVNRFLSDDAPSRLTDYVFGLLARLENATIAGALTDTLKIDRLDMANFIDTSYEAFLGRQNVEHLKNMHFGDEVYDMVSSVDYNHALEVVPTARLLKIDASGALLAMGTYSVMKRTVRRFYKHRRRIEGIAGGVKKLFSDKDFLEEQDDYSVEEYYSEEDDR